MFCRSPVNRFFNGVFAASLFTVAQLNAVSGKDIYLEWQRLPSIPNPEGFAYPYAGVHGDALIVAGGTNFPDKKPWDGGRKVWYDAAYVLEDPKGTWKTGFRLPRPSAYGVSINTDQGVVCIGGGDQSKHYNGVFLLSWKDGALRYSELPSLPTACAYFCGALVGDTIYVAGGIDTPDTTIAMKSFWSLNLRQLNLGWQILQPWPGQGRFLSVAGAQGGAFYLFGGAALNSDVNGKPARTLLLDAYKYTPESGWTRLSDMPHPVVAAPTPATPVGDDHLLIFGGDDGKQRDVPQDQHQGFPKVVLDYDVTCDVWKNMGEIPFSLVATPSAIWSNKVVIPGGEARPGIRSNAVWSASIRQEK